MNLPHRAKRLSIEWSDVAKAQLRSIDRQVALDLLHCTDRYLITREGDVKKLRLPLAGFRLRCGDYRIFFDRSGERGIGVTSVFHRRDAYR